MSKPEYHLMGIGGIGMSAIAFLLLKRGEKVSGCDVKENDQVRSLREAGARVFIGHDKAHLTSDTRWLIYSSAVKADNDELLTAKAMGVSVLKRAQGLAMLMEGKKTITITGAHGKTTTASMTAYVFQAAGLKPTVALGGNASNFCLNAWPGEGDYFIAEADESDSSFLYFSPFISIITNIDTEHLDHYGSMLNLINEFKKFIQLTRPQGLIIANADDETLLGIVKDSKRDFKTYSLKKGSADIWADNIKMNGFQSSFCCRSKAGKVFDINLPLAGVHNISNSLAVISACLQANIAPEVISRTIAGYKGAGRRLEVKLKTPEIMVVDDYAHHPSEIRASLSALRGCVKGQVIAVFQPHRYSRTKLLFEELSEAFGDVDKLILTEIYSASEEPLKGVNSELLWEHIEKKYPGKAVYAKKKDILAKLSQLKGNKTVVFLGAGDITKYADEFVKSFKTDQRPAKA